MSGATTNEAGILQVLIELRDRLTEPLERIEHSLDHVHGSFRDLAASAAEAFVGFEALEHLIGPAEEFQAAQTRLQIALQATNEQLEAFHRQADELSTSMPHTAEEITAAQTALGQVLGSVDAAMRTTETTVQFATATNMDAAGAAQLLGSIYQALGDHTKPVEEGFGNVADKIALLSTRFPGAGGSAQMMARSFARVAEAAKTFGVSIDQTLAAVATLNRLGLGGARGAGVYVQELITQLGKLDAKGVPAVHKLGISLVRTSDGGINLVKTLELLAQSPDKLKRLEQSLGAQGQSVALLVSHLDDLRHSRELFSDAEGTAEDAAAKVNQTYAAAWQEMKNALTDLEVTLGTALLPDLTRALTVIKDIVVAVREFAEAHPMLAQFATEFAAIAASIMVVRGSFLTLVVALKAFHSMHEAIMGPWGIAFAVLVAAAILIYEHWDDVKRIAIETVEAFRRFLEAHPVLAALAEMIAFVTVGLTGFIAAFIAVRNAIAIATAAMELLNVITLANPIGLIIAAVALLVAAAYEIYEHWAPIAAFFERLWAGIVTTFEAAWHKIKPIVDAIKEAFGFLEGVGSKVGDIGSKIGAALHLTTDDTPPGGTEEHREAIRRARGIGRGAPSSAAADVQQTNHYSVTINGADLSNPNAIKGAVTQALQDHAADQQRQADRLSFGHDQ